MIGRSVGRFRILDQLGEGGMGVVWRAEDPLLGRQVALKLLPPDLASMPDARRRFLRGAKAASTLNHPGVCAVFDAGEADGQAYIALACIEGQTLSAAAERSPLPIAEVVRVGIAVADALGFAHAHGVIHRDVTGRNIMLSRDGRVVVLDFGLALVVDLSRLTSSGARVGTVAYMSPEVARGETADARSDLFGLGVVLYEALTGTLPFERERSEAMLYAIIHETPEPPSRRRRDVPPALDAIVMKLLAKEPSERHPTCEALLAELRPLTAMPPPHVAEAPPPAAPRPGTPARHRYLAILPFEVAAAGETSAERDGFVRGLGDVLAAALCRVPDLHVVPTMGAEPHQDRADLQAIARRLGANLLLRALVRFSGSQLRITWSLLDPLRGIQVAGDTVEGTAADTFRLEDRLLESVLLALGFEPPSRAARAGGRDPAAREHFVRALGYLQRYENEAAVDGAIGLLERLHETEPPSAEVEAALARAYLRKYERTRDPRWEGLAAAACERAAGLDRGSADVPLTLGHLYLASGQHERAIESYGRALALDRRRHETLVGLGRAYLAVGQLEDAERSLRNAVAERPDYWGTHNALGRFFDRVGRHEEARAAYQEVLRLTPDNDAGWINMAVALFSLERYDEALESCRRSIEIQPKAQAFSTLGAILFYMERYEEAAVAFERGLALHPEDPMMWGNLGSACRFIPGHEHRSGEALERAVGLARARLGRNARDAFHWSWLGCWLANLQRYDEAVVAIERSLAMEPANPEYMAHAGAVYHQAGCREASFRWLRAAVEHGYPASALERDPYLATLREDDEFIRIMQEHSREHGRRE